MAKNRRKALGDPRIAKPELAPYGCANLRDAMPHPPKKGREEVCAPVAPDRAVRLCLSRRRAAGPTVSSPGAACSFMRNAGSNDRESFYTILLNPQNKVIGVDEIAKGTLQDVEVHPREVFKSAIVANAAGIILAHNHPSGDTTPSRADEAITERLLEASRVLGVPIRDHVIVGDETCTSFRQDKPHMPFQGWEQWSKRRKRGA